MDKYFLLGLEASLAFKENGTNRLLASGAKYRIIKYNERTSLIKDLMDAVVGWDGYIEIFYSDVVEIEQEKNKRQWREFFTMIDLDDNMSDGEFIDYMSKYYKVPEFLHLDEL